MNKATHLIIHHSAVSRDQQKYQFHAINRYHKWKYGMRSSFGFYAGYHWIIEPNGNRAHCRADEDEGAHTLHGWNKRSIGVCLVGDFNREAPTPQQLKRLRELLDKYQLHYMFHKEADSARTCAGIYLTRNAIDRGGVQDKEDYEKALAISKRFNMPFDFIYNLLTK